jgi:hypothetical protein
MPDGQLRRSTLKQVRETGIDYALGEIEFLQADAGKFVAVEEPHQKIAIPDSPGVPGTDSQEKGHGAEVADMQAPGRKGEAQPTV